MAYELNYKACAHLFRSHGREQLAGDVVREAAQPTPRKP